MSRNGIALVLVALLGGCLPTNFVLPNGPEKKPVTTDNPPAAKAPPRPIAPVTAGQITPANAHDKAQDLRGELENDLLNHIEGQDKKEKD